VDVEIKKKVVQRVQTGLRIEKRILKVLKSLAEYHNISLSDLLESVVLHALDGKVIPISDKGREVIKSLKQVYELDLDASDSHNLTEESQDSKGA